MQPNLDGLTPSQKCLWPELSRTPSSFLLYGGVALTLRYNHRHSSDFDFFSNQDIDPDHLLDTVPYLEGAEVLQLAPNTLTCLVKRGGTVKISFFGLPLLKRVGQPEDVEGSQIQMASLLDIAGTKASVVQKRAASRDYLDLHQILCVSQLDLEDILVAARQIYGSRFSPHLTLKALSFFNDGDVRTVNSQILGELESAVARINLRSLERRLEALSQ